MSIPNRRYLFFVHSYPPHEYTGAPLIARDYGTALAAKGHAVGVVYPALEDPFFEKSERIDGGGGPVRYEVPFSELRWTEWSIYDSLFFDRLGERKEALLRNILDEFRPDILCVIDTVNLPCRWMSVLAGSGLPIVKLVVNAEDLCGLIEPFDRMTFEPCPVPLLTNECTERSASVCSAFDRSPHLKSRIGLALERKRRIAIWFYSEVYDLLLFRSSGLEDLFARTLQLEHSRCAVLEAGVALPGARPPKKELHNPSKVRFGYVGSLSVRKGLGLLDEVFRSDALLNRSDYELIFHGNGDEELLQPLLSTNVLVRYAGSYTPENLPGILNDIDVGILPSYFEGGQKAVREMLAWNVPVLASTAFGNTDVVRHGVNGFLFPVGDREMLKRLVVGLLDDKSQVSVLQEGAALTTLRSLEDEIEEFIGHGERFPADRKRTSTSEISMAIKLTAGKQVSSDQSSHALAGEIRLDRVAARAKELADLLEEKRQTIEQLQREFDERTAWALKLNADLESMRERIGSLQEEFDGRTAWALELNHQRQALEQRIQELVASQALLEHRLSLITRSPFYRVLSFLGLVPK